MKTRGLRIIFSFLLAGFAFSMLPGQSAESGPETKITEMLQEAEGLMHKDPENSLKILINAASMAEEGGFTSLEAETEFLLSRAYMNKGYYNTALESGFKALRYYESVGDSSGMGKAKHRLAIINLETENTEVSRQYDTEALQLLNPKKDSLNIGWTNLGLGNYMDHTKKPDSALHYYFIALDLAKKVKNDYLVYACYNNIANMYKDKQDFQTALGYYQKGIELTKRMGENSSTAFTLNNVGALYLKMGKPKEALKYSEEAFGMALEQQSASGLVNIYSNLAKAYEAEGMWEKAYHNQKEYTQLIEDYFNEKRTSSMADMEAKYQNEKKQAEIALLNKENEFQDLKIDRQRSLQNLMAAGLGLLFMFVIVIILAYRDKQKTNRLLHEQQEEIKRINAGLERMVKERTEALASMNTELNELLYRTSHDLRTPITKLMGLVGLAKTQAMPAETVLDYIDQTMELLNQQNLSICEIGIIRHHNPTPVETDLKTTLEGVVRDLKDHPQFEGQEIKLEVDEGINCLLNPYLFRIAVKEVAGNALAFGTNQSAPIRITAQKVGPHLRLEVRDQGPGIPDEIRDSLFDLFVKGANTPGHFGLGLYKARLAVEQLGGTLTYQSVPGEGTAFEIRMDC